MLSSLLLLLLWLWLWLLLLLFWVLLLFFVVVVVVVAVVFAEILLALVPTRIAISVVLVVVFEVPTQYLVVALCVACSHCPFHYQIKLFPPFVTTFLLLLIELGSPFSATLIALLCLP